MATFSIAETNDDGMKSTFGGGTYYTNQISLGYFQDDNSDSRIGCFRFTNVTIPQGSTINTAKITLTKLGNDTSTGMNWVVWGIDEDNTASMSTDPTGRTLTTANTAWSNVGPFTDLATYDTPSIVSVVQEITDRAGWASGNAMGFLIKSALTGTKVTISFYDYADNSSYVAVLTVTYTVGSASASASISPSASLSPSSSGSASRSASLSASASASASQSPSGSLSPSGSPSPSGSTSASASSSPSVGTNYGLVITKPGYDVKTTTDEEKMIFTSGKGALGFRSVQTISGTTDVNGLINTSYTHGLGYVPIVLCTITTRDGTVINVPGTWESVWSKFEYLHESFMYWIDNDKIYVNAHAYHSEDVQGGSSTDLEGQAYNFKAVIYFNELNDEY